MTDKQMEEKKKAFIIKLAEYRTLCDNAFHSDTEEEILYLIRIAGDVLWDSVKELVEEVEDECEKKSFENFKKRLMLDLEKKLTI